jgi:hypothetical protein
MPDTALQRRSLNLSHTPAPKEISSQFVLTLQARALRASLTVWM